VPHPLFSIITPTCNRPVLLARNITSVQRQTFADYEHLIIDDGGDPATEAIVSHMKDARIRLLKSHTHRGAAWAYNAGMQAARGRFYTFLDDDDEYLPEYLQKMQKRFESAEPHVGFIWTGISRILDSENGEEELHSLVWPSIFANAEEGMAAATSIGNGYGLCVRKECVDAIGPYDESLSVCEDTDFLFRLAEMYGFETIPEVLVKIHKHNHTQLTGIENLEMRIACKEQILARHARFMQSIVLYITCKAGLLWICAIKTG
jgi:glycosyltransferase involved in cell wall biosynthesis